MTTHTDTKNLRIYTSGSYPNIEGGAQKFVATELSKIQASINAIITVMRLLEARMNTNGLT